MSKKKSKLFLSITALVFCLGIMCFGVYAATSVSYTLRGNITYNVTDVFVDIETRHYLSTQTDSILAKGETAGLMQSIAESLETGTTSIEGVTELISDYDKQSTLNYVGGENLALTGPELNVSYGSYSNTSGQEKAFVHYIAILVTNYAEEEINGILNLDNLYGLQDSNTVIFSYQTMNNVPAKSEAINGTKCFVFALGLDDPAQSVDVNFTGVELSVTRGNLDQYASEGLEYEYSEADGGYLVSKYTGSDKKVIVPSTYDDNGANGEHNVVGTKSYYASPQGGQIFDESTTVVEIFLPNTFKNIGVRTFYDTNLTSITLPNSITNIGDSAFAYCPYLTSMVIPSELTGLGCTIFSGSTNLESVDLSNCTNLTTLGKFLGFGSNNIFSGTKISSIVIPATVNNIWEGVFNGCDTLEMVTFEDTETEWTVTYRSTSPIIITNKELQNSNLMATYFTDTYANYQWTKNI